MDETNNEADKLLSAYYNAGGKKQQKKLKDAVIKSLKGTPLMEKFQQIIVEADRIDPLYGFWSEIEKLTPLEYKKFIPILNSLGYRYQLFGVRNFDFLDAPPFV